MVLNISTFILNRKNSTEPTTYDENKNESETDDQPLLFESSTAKVSINQSNSHKRLYQFKNYAINIIVRLRPRCAKSGFVIIGLYITSIFSFTYLFMPFNVNLSEPSRQPFYNKPPIHADSLDSKGIEMLF